MKITLFERGCAVFLNKRTLITFKDAEGFVVKFGSELGRILFAKEIRKSTEGNVVALRCVRGRYTNVPGRGGASGGGGTRPGEPDLSGE